ncbi:SDR family oxidoreductase [Rossellomorea vietnamensis]|uniref:SDR family oxidoreductase n=1 Tax=Rossellomorea vietnamensis TaxID=218284 RepID=A0A6I6UMM7_9BACI|nr:SDR family oxidoreductase [Rossellomorea vietnamensis]QHE59810.1 SDR family oxidoreductase [Rossellomorea vietnamensis]
MNKKIIFITGSSSGIGYGITTRLLEEGHTVIGTFYNNENRSRELESTFSNFEGIYLDLNDSMEKINTKLDHIIEKYGDLNILINCAAEVSTIQYEEANEKDFNRILEINLKKPYFLIQSLYKKHKNNKCQLDTIINISSISDKYAFSGLSLYEMSKAALSMMTRSLAYEFAETGIRVNGVAPGAVFVEKNHGDSNWENIISNVVPLGRPGLPKDIASVVTFLISEESGYVSGQVLYVDGGLSLRL